MKLPNVKFYFAGDGHNHWHFTDFDDYWIENLDGTRPAPREARVLPVGQHVTCDAVRRASRESRSSPVYAYETTCGQGLQNTLDHHRGLSRGWGDTYPSSLPDQAIDITGLPDGRYRVGITADAFKAVKEQNETNNTATMEIRSQGTR